MKKNDWVSFNQIRSLFVCWQPFQLDFDAGARTNHSGGWLTAAADLNRYTLFLMEIINL
jgi:hypothetical protein